MKITILGGAGFIGTNLAKELAKTDKVTIIDKNDSYFTTLRNMNLPLNYQVFPYHLDSDFDVQLKGTDVLYHLASTNIPGDSNRNIAAELEANVTVTAKLFDACIRQGVKKVVFISSGGAVYGKTSVCPIPEDTVTNPITSYGVQKLTIEKLLYLYHYQAGLDYNIIRLANPYGPYQRPNGRLGVISTFIYKAMTDGKLEVYGDGSVVRDFIYIDDAVKGIIRIANGKSKYRLFNLGTGKGTSVNQVIDIIKKIVRNDIIVDYIAGRSVDVPVNYLDISRYENEYGSLNPISLEDGVRKTAEFYKGISL